MLLRAPTINNQVIWDSQNGYCNVQTHTQIGPPHDVMIIILLHMFGYTKVKNKWIVSYSNNLRHFTYLPTALLDKNKLQDFAFAYAELQFERDFYFYLFCKEILRNKSLPNNLHMYVQVDDVHNRYVYLTTIQMGNTTYSLFIII